MYAKVILKWIFKKQVLRICTGLILAEYWDQSRAFVYTVMNLRVPSKHVISWPLEGLLVSFLYTRCSGAEKVWFVATATIMQRWLPHLHSSCSLYCLFSTSTVDIEAHTGNWITGWNYPESEFCWWYQSKSHYDRQSVGQSVLTSGAHLGPATNFSFPLRFSFRHLRFVIM
jgi:hypothetical protein